MSDWRSEYRKDVGEVLDEAPWTIWKITVKVILPIIMIGVVFSGVYWAYKIISTPARVMEKSLDPDRVIYNYEWYKSTYQHIKALDTQIENAKTDAQAFETASGPRAAWDFQDKQEDARLHAVLQGLQQQRANEVAEYNARSSEKTRNFTKDDNLPDNIQ